MQQPDSNVVGDVTCQVGTKQSRTIDRYRVVTFCDHEGHDIRVVTNVMGVSAEEIAEMYKGRWAIESFFHWIKGYLDLPILFDNSKKAVFTQIFIVLSVFVLLKWFFDQVKKAVKKSISFRSFTRSFFGADSSRGMAKCGCRFPMSFEGIQRKRVTYSWLISRRGIFL
ncbi:transposase [Sporosarcina limicola]|uniref:Transposase IS4-like domain-containing protein n=1 Tax=Sporosarcina limicola TaxID=34101 RepID=A0A927R676_9BACL|nr:transposase [Sporosarcina limicola]MBE1556893.1 hypothetical protein [Sporosarcina limicola]